jgi:hypothetical protein
MFKEGDFPISETSDYYHLVWPGRVGPPVSWAGVIRRFSKSKWTLKEVRAWREGYIRGRNYAKRV